MAKNNFSDEVLITNAESLRDKIYTIRGQKVMLDYDLAKIYGYTTKAFNQQVRNNIEKFDEDFRFQLDESEIHCSRSKNLTLNGSSSSRSQIVTLNTGRGSNIKYLPYAFTEQGIYMLMTVLKGELATKQSKALIRLFKQLKDYALETREVLEYRGNLELATKIMETQKDVATAKL